MAENRQGRPVVRTEPWAKITVILLDRHVAELDRLAIEIRLRHGRAVSRAGLIGALVEAAFQSGVDLTQASSPEDIVLLLAGKQPPKGRLRAAK